MIYRVLGLMSGSSLDGVDIAYCVLEENGGKWQYIIQHTACKSYPAQMQEDLLHCNKLSLEAYLQLDVNLGIFFAEATNEFIEAHNLHHKVHLIASHGHTTLHSPQLGFSAQIGCGATLSALTGIAVVNQLRCVDVALGGSGAPIVPIAEQLLFADAKLFLNIGGICNISVHKNDHVIAYDICAANRVLNLLANKLGKAYDENGDIAKQGKLNEQLLQQLNALPYFSQKYPKSLANEFGQVIVLDIINQSAVSTEDAMCTMTHHIAQQIAIAVSQHTTEPSKMLVTGGGAHNKFLMQLIAEYCAQYNCTIEIPDAQTIDYKEALAMAVIGTLRWREENNVLSSVTGATRNSIGGALWTTQ
jgi:anhydro-N-acetylmuramic acid kinase